MTGTAPADSDPRAIPVLPYALRWRPRGQAPGAHPAAGRGGEGLFQGLVPLLAQADPRRIDIRASLHDPFEAIHARAFAPRRAATVAVMLDLSGSMGFGGVRSEVAQLAATVAASAHACGDAFCLLAADAAPRPELHIPPTRRRGLAGEVRARIASAACAGASGRGLAATAEHLPRGRALVFLISDFLMPEADITAVLDSLWRHQIIPVVARDSRAENALPPFGLLDLQDAETGRRRLVVMHPRLRARWQAQAAARRAALDALFAARGAAPFHLVDRFDPDALLDHLARR